MDNILKLDELCTYLYSMKKRSWIKLSMPKKAFLYKSNQRTNLLTGEIQDYKIKKFIKKLDKKKMFKTKSYEIYHLFYDFGNKLINLPTDQETVLAIEIQYQHCTYVNFQNCINESIDLKELSAPNKENYIENIKKIHQEIKKGEFYQLNFTKKWVYQFSETLPLLLKFFSTKEKLGSMAQITLAPIVDKVWLSNTPECLFVSRKEDEQISIDTFPIKGTSYLSKGFAEAKKTLSDSLKDLAELDMITDLMRNDLNKLQLPKAQVLKRRFFFTVPGLLQQASWIRGVFNRKLKLGELIKALFPGGSITGAPKISAMKTIKILEVENRAFYCGSTIFHSQSNCSASINIRSATLSLSEKKLNINAGGGITLLSDAESEWAEMMAKKNSLLKIWE